MHTMKDKTITICERIAYGLGLLTWAALVVKAIAG